MIITPARPRDIDTIMGWRRQRVAWLTARGEDRAPVRGHEKSGSRA